MALFTRRDRIAITIITLLIVSGWAVRYYVHLNKSQGEIRVLRNAVKLPEVLEYPEKRSAVLININTAGKEELETLPMIGPVRASEIIAYREKHGDYEKKSDILKVHGIGQATYDKIKDNITVSLKDATVKEKRVNEK